MHADLFSYRIIDGRAGYSPSLNAVCRLRYQVYVNEWGFERAQDHPAGLEQDEYDQHSLHFCAFPRHSEDVIGAARIILGAERPLPIERHFDIRQFPAGVKREQAAEISRLAVSKEFRCQAIKRAIFGTDQTKENTHPRIEPRGDFRRIYEHQLVRGLYIALYRESKLMDLTHWFTVMAKGLYVILKRWGVEFTQIGPAQEYHGLRAPYLISLAAMERSLERNNPGLFREMQYSLLH